MVKKNLVRVLALLLVLAMQMGACVGFAEETLPAAEAVVARAHEAL